MSTRTLLIIFVVVFALGLFLIVILPFLLGAGPASPRSGADERGPQALADQGVFRSDDGGRTWQQKTFVEGEAGSIAGFRVNRVIPHPTNAAAMFLATDGSGLWVSESRGDLWAPVIDGAGVLDPRSNVLDIAVNPANGEEWYVAVFQGERGRVFRSADGGETFAEVYATPAERFGVFAVRFDPRRGTVLVATGHGGLLESADQGRTWRVVRWFAEGLLELLINPTSPAARYVVTPRGNVFRSLDAGVSWSDVSPALREFSGATLNQRWVLDRAGTLSLGSHRGLLRSTDQGATFAEVPLIFPPSVVSVLAVAVDPQHASRVVVAAGGQLYRSDDGGSRWAILPPPSQKRITHLLIDGENSETIYAVAQP